MPTVTACARMLVGAGMVLLAAGCTSEREMAFGAGAAPTTSTDRVAVRVARITQAPGVVGVDLELVNATDRPLVLARDYDRFPSVTLTHDHDQTIGVKQRLVSRLATPTRYTILAGEETAMRMRFAAAGIDHAGDAMLTIVGTMDGRAVTWRLPVPLASSDSPQHL